MALFLYLLTPKKVWGLYWEPTEEREEKKYIHHAEELYRVLKSKNGWLQLFCVKKKKEKENNGTEG